MKRSRITQCLLAIIITAFATALSPICTKASADAERGFTHVFTTNNPDCYAEITIEGNHFTVDGRAVNDPVNSVGILTDSVDISNYEFTMGANNSFHAEFDAEDAGDSSNFWIWSESYLVMYYRIQHDKNGWYFPDNGLAVQNAQKLENILTAVPEASAYYISQTADHDEIEQTLAELGRIVKEVCGNEQDDYRKAYLLYRWEAENIYYDLDAANTEVTLDTVAIHNVLERRRTTCAGYANTYCALLEIAGIRSVNLKGSAVSRDVTYEKLLTAGENHEFSAFWYEAENRWVYVDATWGSNGRYTNGEYNYNSPATDKYFDVTDEIFALDHRVDKVEERNYMGALNTDAEAETPESESSGVSASEPTQSITDPPDITSGTDSTNTPNTPAASPNVTSADETDTGRDIVIYIAIGVAGVIIVTIGIILAVRKK